MIGVLDIVLLFFDRASVSSRLIYDAAVVLWIVVGLYWIDFSYLLLQPSHAFMLSVRILEWFDFGFLMSTGK